MCVRPLANFLDASEVKLLSEKWSKSTVELGQISKFLLDFLKKTRFSPFSCNKNGFRCRMTTRVDALQSPHVGEAFQYLKHVFPTSRNFLNASEVKLLSEKWPTSTVEFGKI